MVCHSLQQREQPLHAGHTLRLLPLLCLSLQPHVLPDEGDEFVLPPPLSGQPWLTLVLVLFLHLLLLILILHHHHLVSHSGTWAWCVLRDGGN